MEALNFESTEMTWNALRHCKFAKFHAIRSECMALEISCSGGLIRECSQKKLLQFRQKSSNERDSVPF